jgi:hypothetical protein
LKYINDFNNSSIEKNSIMQIPYQLIHRTASACSLRKENTYVIYQLFIENENKYKKFYENDLKNLNTLIKNICNPLNKLT